MCHIDIDGLRHATVLALLELPRHKTTACGPFLFAVVLDLSMRTTQSTLLGSGFFVTTKEAIGNSSSENRSTTTTRTRKLGKKRSLPKISRVKGTDECKQPLRGKPAMKRRLLDDHHRNIAENNDEAENNDCCAKPAGAKSIKQSNKSETLALKPDNKETSRLEAPEVDAVGLIDDTIIEEGGGGGTATDDSLNENTVILRTESQALLRSHNVVHHLMHGGIYGTGLIKRRSAISANRDGSYIDDGPPQLPSAWSPTYAPSGSVVLQGPLNNHSNPTVKNASFDADGVLLAVHYSQTAICIYDWDTVRAVQMKVKQEVAIKQSKVKQDQDPHHRNSPNVGMGVAPFLTIPFRQRYTPSSAPSVVWNPFQPDEIATLNWDTGVVTIFDLAEVRAWQESSHRFRNGSSSLGKMPSRTLATGNRGSAEACGVLWVDPNHLLVHCGDLSLYRTTEFLSDTNTTTETIRTKLQWRLSWEPVSCMTRLSSKNEKADAILLGSTTGHMAVVYWKELQPQASFSVVSPRPRIVSWKAQPSQKCYRGMPMSGIRHFWNDSNSCRDDKNGLMGSDDPAGSSTTSNDLRHPSSMGRRNCLFSRVSWITAGGWLLECQYNLTKRRPVGGSTTVLHATRQVECVKHTPTTKVDSGDKTTATMMVPGQWSCPVKADVRAANAPEPQPDLLLFSRVPPAYRLLDHHNPTVLMRRPHEASLSHRAATVPPGLWLLRRRHRCRRRSHHQEQQQQEGGSDSGPDSTASGSNRHSGDGGTCPQPPSASSPSLIDLQHVALSRRRGPPTALAVHPSHEAVVVGTEQHGVYILNETPATSSSSSSLTAAAAATNTKTAPATGDQSPRQMIKTQREV